MLQEYYKLSFKQECFSNANWAMQEQAENLSL